MINRSFIILSFMYLQPFGPCRTWRTSRTMETRWPAGPRSPFVGIYVGVTDGIAYARARALADPGRGGVDVPRRPEAHYPLGKGGQAQRNSDPGRPPPLP